MGIFSRKTRVEAKVKKHVLDNEDRASSLELRKMNKEIKITAKQYELEEAQARLQDLRDEIDEARETLDIPTDDSSMMSMLAPLLMAKLGTQGNTQHPTNPTPTLPTALSEPPSGIPESSTGSVGVTISPDQMQAMWDDVPKNLKRVVKKMTDAKMTHVIRSHEPNISPGSLKDVIAFIRTK